MEDKVRIRFEVKTADARKELERFGVSFDKTTKKATLDLEKLADGFKRAGRRLSLFITAPLAGLGYAAIKTAGEFEKQKVAFETMLGSAEKAKTLLQDMIKFSAKTPFQLPQIEELSAQLLSFGVKAEDVIDVMGRLGDVSMGDSEKLGRLTHAYGVLRARGVATLEQLNMFTEAGVPIMQELADQYGVTTNELFKMVSQGKVSFNDVNNALIRMTSEGGQFYEMTEKQSETFLGLWSTMKDNIKLLAQTFGDLLLPKLKEMIDHFIKIIQKFQDMSPAGKKAILILGGIAATIPPIILAIGTLISMFNKMKMAMNLVSSVTTFTNPIGLIVIAIAGLATAGYLVITHWKEIKETLIDIWNGIKTFVSNIVSKIADAIKQNLVDRFFRVIDRIKEGVENIKGAFKNLFNKLVGHSIVPELVDKIQENFDRMNDYFEAKKDEILKNMKSPYEVFLDYMTGTFTYSFADAWEAIWFQTGDTSKKIKKALKELIVTTLKGLAKQYAAMAATFAVLLMWGKAAQYAAASAALLLAAQWINNHLQQGGLVEAIRAQQGYGGGDVVPAMLEPGEMVIRKEVVKEQGAILNMINSGEPAPLHIQLHIGSKLIFDEISKASRDGKIIIDKRAIRV